jgi:WD40 repeat protein
VLLDLRSGLTTLLADDASEPVFAPDGKIAMVRDHFGKSKSGLGEPLISSSELLVTSVSGSAPVSILRVHGGLSWPSWDPSGERLAFTRLYGSGRSFPNPGQRRSIEQVNADGSCRTPLLSLSRAFFAGVAWQPGADRGAGRIACG